MNDLMIKLMEFLSLKFMLLGFNGFLSKFIYLHTFVNNNFLVYSSFGDDFVFLIFTTNKENSCSFLFFKSAISEFNFNFLNLFCQPFTEIYMISSEIFFLRISCTCIIIAKNYDLLKKIMIF